MVLNSHFRSPNDRYEFWNSYWKMLHLVTIYIPIIQLDEQKNKFLNCLIVSKQLYLINAKDVLKLSK